MAGLRTFKRNARGVAGTRMPSVELLVDDGWKVVEVEPETVSVNGSGVNGNGHHDTVDIGPTVELMLGNGHKVNGNGNSHSPAPVHGDDHHDETPEPQQSLFS